MYEYTYKLKYKSEVYICKKPVSGFENEGIKFGKSSSDMGVIKSYVSEFQFLHEDAQFIKNITINYGFNEVLKIEIYKHDFLKGDSLEYSGLIDLSTTTIYSNKVTCSVKEGGFITYLDNISKTKKSITAGYKYMQYRGNQYNFDAYLKAKTEFEMYYSPNLKNILEINLLENNDNLEDIRMFAKGGNRQLNVSELEKLTDDDCFFISNTQEYLKTIKTNLNINTFTQDNHRVPFGTAPVAAKIKYKYEVLAYSNLLEEWLTTDNSLIFKNDFYVTQNYRLISRATGQVDNGYIYCDTIATANNVQVGYQNNSSIGLILNDKNKNFKIVINVSMIQMEYIDATGNRFDPLNDFGAGANFKYNCTPNVEVKMTFDDYKLVSFHSQYVYHVADVYKSLITSKSANNYNINFNLSAIENTPLYLASSGMLCAGIELKTSLDELLQFIYLATGLRHIVDLHDNVYYVSFEKYENSFKDIEIAKIENASEIVIETEPDKIYTDVEIGWANKDSGIFKSLEYNTINKFRTQYNNIESNTLALNCTYSASTTDIETIIYNAGFNDKENNVDDIFIIHGYNDNGILRNVQTVGVAPMTLCSNVLLTPKRLLDVHRFELSDFLYHLNVLKFNTTNGLAAITLDGVTENTDVTFNNQIMQPFVLSFEGVINESVIKIDGRKYGYFTFMYNGEYIRGYIAEGSDSVSVAANGNVSNLRLIVKKSVIL
jgi:hypothetical protein